MRLDGIRTSSSTCGHGMGLDGTRMSSSSRAHRMGVQQSPQVELMGWDEDKLLNLNSQDGTRMRLGQASQVELTDTSNCTNQEDIAASSSRVSAERAS